MIFQFDHKCEIGEIVYPNFINGLDGTPLPIQPLVIIRESTFDEWKKEIENDGGRVSVMDMKYHIDNPQYRFYEVSSD